MNEQTWPWGRFFSSGLPSPAPIPPDPPIEKNATPALPPGPRKKGSPRWPILALVLAATIAGTMWGLRRKPQFDGGGGGVIGGRTAKAFIGPFEKTLRVSGAISAKNYAAIVAPQMRGREGRGGGSSGGGGGRGDGGAMVFSGVSSSTSQLVLVKLAPAGSLVKKGDPVAEFDNQWEEEHIEDHRARVIQTRALVDRRRAEIAIEAEAHQQLLRATRADSEKARLDLKTAEIRSEIDAEKLKLMVEETAARYKQLQEDVKPKKISQEAELKVLEMQVDQEQNHVDRHTRNLQRMTMKAPIDGLVVMQPIYRSGQFGQVQEGDQVFPGSYFMQIVDTTQMVVSGTVNQADSQGLALGQKATIRLEAYPDLVLPARLTSVGAMASASTRGMRGGSRETFVRQIPVRFAIEAADKRVIPDLSASAEVKFKTEPRSLQIPREAVLEENGRSCALVRQGEGFQKREIRIGGANNTHAVVLAGLSEGDEVSLEK